jgi:predicted nuclease of predicted toxin-antitoxin system
MYFVADENVPRSVLDRLRTSGYDVVSIQETFAGVSDRGVLKVAESQHRILITADRDFGELSVRHMLGATGVIVFQLERLSHATRADRVAR